MQADFWQQRWQRRELGFHLEDVNPLLLAHAAELKLTRGQNIFIPLCGKSRDIAWWLASGMKVVAVELSEIAVHELFEELGLTATIEDRGEFKIYSAEYLKVFQGDIFSIDKEELGVIDACYDRAALVALPREMRLQYVSLIRQIVKGGVQLIITMTYDQSSLSGPPFSIEESELREYYEDQFEVSQLAQLSIAGGLKGKIPAMEEVYLLRSR